MPPPQNVPEEIPCEIAGKRRFCIWNDIFELDTRYEPQKPIGKGAFGIVCSAKDTVTQQRVAIKKIKNAFGGGRTQAIRCLREVNLLRHVSHRNIIQIRGISEPKSYESFEDVYVVYECMDTDLHQIIRSRQALTTDHYKYFTMQILSGLMYLHSANIIHRDLKPSNLLINKNCDLKIADFGLARSKDCRDDLTQYVVTRYYRAPEVLMGALSYTEAIDLWSVGCILAELIKGAPIFKGRSQLDTLIKVAELVGKPTDDDMQHLGHIPFGHILQTLPPTERRLENEFPDADPHALDLLSSLLQFNPHKRPTAAEALSHRWFDDMRDPAMHIVAQNAFEYEFDEDALSTEEIRERMKTEIQIWSTMAQHA